MISAYEKQNTGYWSENSYIRRRASHFQTSISLPIHLQFSIPPYTLINELRGLLNLSKLIILYFLLYNSE